MNSLIRLSLKKAKHNLPQLVGLLLLITIGVGFFLTLFTIKLRYQESAQRYFQENHFASFTLKGEFSQSSLAALEKLKGVNLVQGRQVQEVRQGDRVFRLVSLTEGINDPYLYSGRLPHNQEECAILKRSADAMGLTVGSTLSLAGKNYQITGLVASPEYMYLYQNPRTPMAQAAGFAVLYLPQTTATAFNEILLLTNDPVQGDNLKSLVQAQDVIAEKDHFSTQLYQSDLDQIGSFAYIFPVIFALLIGAMIAVMLSRMVQKDRKQIGILKALGRKDGAILTVYLLPFALVATLGSLLGLGAAFLLGDWMIGLFAAMFEVPGLSFSFYGNLFLQASICALAISLLSGVFSLLPVAQLFPALALRPKVPKQGKRLLLEGLPLWKKTSFNTRYTIKGMVKGKWRILVVVLGMAASCALLAFSLGFYNSVSHTLDQHMASFARYDIIIDLPPQPLSQTATIAKDLDKSYKALSLPVRVLEKDTLLVICENNFDMVNLPSEMLNTGVIVPAYLAEQWGVTIGDNLEVDGYKTVVSGIIPQVMGLNIFTSYEYLHSLNPDLPQVYNTLYGQSTRLPEVVKELQKDGHTFSTREDDRQSFETIMESMGILIVFLIAFSVVLGLVVLYSVGLISLSTKEFEYMFMSIMGYGRRRVFSANLKEMLLQLALGLPLGCLLANFLLKAIKGEFSTDNFVMQPYIASSSYMIAIITVIIIATLMALLTDRRVNRLDIVQGLKEQDD